MSTKVMSILICVIILTSVSAAITQNSGQSSSNGIIYVDDDNTTGIEDGSLQYPYNTIQEGVNMSSSEDTVYVFNGTYCEDVVVNKTINLIGEHRENTIINGSGEGDVVTIIADRVNINGFTVRNSGFVDITPFYVAGIKLYNVQNCSIINNNASDNFRGIYLFSSSNNNIIGNNFLSNTLESIMLRSSSNNIVMANNVSDSCYGVRLFLSSHDNIITDNKALNNSYGITLYWFNNNNTIKGNNVLNNWLGISLHSSLINNIYHNNIIDNTYQARDSDPINNSWHHPILLEGNYWSDYTGLDDGSGMGKHAIAGDGIGDTKISHPTTYYDFYPLMQPWNPRIYATIDIDPDTLHLGSKGKWITCYIELPEGYDVNDIDIGSVTLEDVILSEWGDIQNDLIMIKFDRSEVEDMLSPGTYNLKVTGELADGTSFEGYSDEIRVIEP